MQLLKFDKDASQKEPFFLY